MPAQRKRRRIKSVATNKKKIRFLKLLLIVIIPIVSITYIIFNSKHWDGENKLPIAIAGDEGDVTVAVFDPELGEITLVVIPKDTQVEVARNLGTLRIKNVRQLGENEGLSGQLLAETITSYFKLPVSAWAERSAEGLFTSNIPSLFSAVISPYNSSLNMGDRIRLAFFSAGVNNNQRFVFDLADTSFLKKTTLKDGQPGLVTSGNIPNNILVIFSDPEISKSGLTLAIFDSTSNRITARKVGEVIEVLGAKVAAIIEKEPTQFDCKVIGNNRRVVEKIAALFSCAEYDVSKEGEFDIQIEIGDKFAERF